MIGYISNMKIGHRIAVAVAIPVFGILLLSSFGAYQNYKTYSQTNQLAEVVSVIAELNALTHVLQVERGRSAGYIANGVQEETPKSILDARSKVDDEVAKYLQLADHFRQIVHGEVAEDIKAMDRDIASIDAFRRKIDEGSTTAGEALGFYSKIIKHIFEISFHATELSTDPTISLEILAMLNLGEAKEFAGRERGLINGVLAKGEITLAQRRAFYGLIASQERLEENFINSEPEKYRGKYKKLLAESGIQEVETLRKAISANTGDLAASGIDQAAWFRETTNRINSLRSIELKASTDIVADTRKISEAAFSSMMLNTGFSFGLAVLAAIAGAVVTGSITKPLSRLVTSMQKITEGDLEVEVPGQGMRSEIGSIANAVLVFLENAVQKRQMRQEADAAEAERAERQAERDAEKAKADEETRHIVSTLGQAMEQLASGDLTSQIDEGFGQGLDGLRTSYNSAVVQLADTLAMVTGSIGTIHNNANEMRSATDLLSTRTEDQAKSLQEASASIEEITATVKQSAEDAQSASAKANEAKQDAEKSRDVVENAVTSMGRIEEASKQIASIIGVIDEISFQTNLLALNAGVEAARAGESGKGFAVVAQEVRELAQRSTEAAQDIKQLIESSTLEVEQGVKNVTATGEALNTISEHVSDISEFIASIAVATGEQSIGLDECNRSVNLLDGSTQQNAAMAEQTTAVTNQLANDANELAQLVTRFKVTKGAADDAGQIAA